MNTFYGLDVQITQHVAEIRLNRPDELNAFDDQLHHSFADALDMLTARHEVRAIVLSAEGRAFSAGGSFDYIEQNARDPEARKSIHAAAHRVFTTLVAVNRPVIAALHGDAIGLGATIVTACDMVIAARTARLADPHVRVGLGAGDGGVASWSLAVGIMRAKRHLLTGDPLSAEEAWSLGMVTDLVDQPEDARPAAMKLAQRVAALPPIAVQGTKQAFVLLAQQLGTAAFELSLDNEVQCLDSQDLLEAIAAAREKRKGVYTGR